LQLRSFVDMPYAELQSLRKLGITNIDIDKLAVLPPTNLASLMFITDRKGNGDFFQTYSSIELRDVYRSAVRLQVDPLRLVEQIRPILTLETVPIDLPDTERLPVPSPFAHKLLSRDLDGQEPIRARLDALDLAHAAFHWKEPIAKLAGAVDDLARCGVETGEARQFLDFCAKHSSSPIPMS